MCREMPELARCKCHQGRQCPNKLFLARLTDSTACTDAHMPWSPGSPSGTHSGIAAGTPVQIRAISTPAQVQSNVPS